MKLLIKIILIASLFFSGHVFATLEVDIVQNKHASLPLVIGSFNTSSDNARFNSKIISTIIFRDLKISGQFVPKKTKKHISLEISALDFSLWKNLKFDAVLAGKIKELANKKYEISYKLFDLYIEKEISAGKWQVAETSIRSVAHLISDQIYYAITGEQGSFSSKIAYVTYREKNNKNFYTLEIADIDGNDAQTIFRSFEPILSPSWSPNGKRLAYVSFEYGRSKVFIHNLFKTNKRFSIPSFEGVAGAPDFSPDGTKIALSLSHKGNQDIYIYDLLNNKVQRVTSHPNIDTEPVWTPDAKSLLFTSDRGKAPQVYQIDLASRKVTRISFVGRNNSSADISGDGKLITMVQGDYGVFKVVVMNRQTREVSQITSGLYDESPSFSANGKMLIYAGSKGDKGVLSSISIDGRSRQNLLFLKGAVREPSWGPVIK